MLSASATPATITAIICHWWKAVSEASDDSVHYCHVDALS